MPRVDNATTYLAALVVMLMLPAAASTPAYQIVVASGLDQVEVTVPAGLSRLRTRGEARPKLLDNLRRVGTHVELIDPARAGRYSAKLQHGRRQKSLARHHPNVQFSDWRDWLLLPDGMGSSDDAAAVASVLLEFQLAPDALVMLPFEPVDLTPGAPIYEAHPLMLGHGGFAAFGAMDIRLREFPGAEQIAVAVIGDRKTEHDRYQRWVGSVARTVFETHGCMPPASHVVVVPAPFGRGEVPWAHVRRGGGSGVIAYVNRDAADADLYEDWTLYHEFAHLFHPYLGDSGRWVGEGFASYFQNLYRARAGVVTSDYAWGRLLAGLERGADESREKPGRTVTQGGRMRTYWTAAALALAADTELRRRTDGADSLELLLGRFVEADLPSTDAWRPRDFMRRLDELSESVIFTRLYDDYVGRHDFPVVRIDPDSGVALMGGG